MSFSDWSELNSTEITGYNRDDSDSDTDQGASKFNNESLILDVGTDTTLLLDNTVIGGVDPSDVSFELQAYVNDTNQFGVMLGARVNPLNGHGYYAALLPSNSAEYAKPAILKFDSGVWSNLGFGTIYNPAVATVLKMVFKLQGTSLKFDVFDIGDLVVPKSTQSIVDASIAAAGKLAIRKSDNISPVSVILSSKVFVGEFVVTNLTGV